MQRRSLERYSGAGGEKVSEEEIMDGLTSPEGVAGGNVRNPAEHLTGQDRRTGVSC